MARLISIVTGNLVDAGTWGLVDSTSLLDSEANNTALTGSYVASSNFTPGIITIDGIAVKLASRAASPNGTISINLRNTTLSADVSGTEVTLDVADLPLCTTTDKEGGWVFFKFSAPVTLLAATNYAVQAKTSQTSQVNLYRDGTSNNWSRMLRTTTTQAPAAADNMDVMGEHTGQGTGNNITVTMNQTATTDYGPGSDSAVAMTINKRGTLIYGTTAATNYYLKLSGDLIVYNGGTLTIGTSGTPIPTDSSAVLEFDPVADGGMGLIIRNGATVTIRGKTVTPWVYLNADASAAATTLTAHTAPTGWKSGDNIVIPTTSRTWADSEVKALTGDVSSTSIPITAITNAHTGIAPSRAEMGNLNRNVKIRSATSTIMAYVNIKATAIVDIQYAEHYYIGTNTTAKRGVEVETTTGSCVFSNNSIHDTEGGGFYTTGAATNNITASNNYFYLTCTVANISTLVIAQTTGTTITIDSNVLVKSGTGTAGAITINDLGITFTNNVLAGGSSSGSSGGISIGEMGDFANSSGNVMHSIVGAGAFWIGSTNEWLRLKGFSIWRCNQAAFRFETFNFAYLELVDFTLFGNSNNFQFLSRPDMIVFKNANIYRESSTYPTTNGYAPSGNRTIIINSNIGGNGVHSSGADIAMPSNSWCQVECINTTLGSATPVSGATGSLRNSFCRLHKNGGVSTAHTSYYVRGNILADQTTRHTASGNSWKMTPNALPTAPNVRKLVFPGPTEFDAFKVGCKANQAVTIKVYVYKDASYNGNQPRLVVVGGLISGISTDQIATATSASNQAWEQLSVTVTPTEDGAVEFYVDCDGSAGNAYVDDVSFA